MERLQVFVMILPYSTVSLQYPTMFLSIILHYIPKDILQPILFSNLIVANHSSNVLATFTLVAIRRVFQVHVFFINCIDQCE